MRINDRAIKRPVGTELLFHAASAKDVTMKQSTLVAMKAILESDPLRTKADREQLLRALGLDENAKDSEGKAERIVSFEEAAQRLACTKRTLHNIVDRGGLVKVRFPGSTKAHGFLASDIDSLLVSGRTGDAA
jgi:hypothetical protein